MYGRLKRWQDAAMHDSIDCARGKSRARSSSTSTVSSAGSRAASRLGFPRGVLRTGTSWVFQVRRLLRKSLHHMLPTLHVLRVNEQI